MPLSYKRSTGLEQSSYGVLKSFVASSDAPRL